MLDKLGKGYFRVMMKKSSALANAILQIFLVLLPAAVRAQSDLLITEIMADNRSSVADLDKEYPDWIEVFNAGAKPIDLAGYALTDDVRRPNQWAFPAVTLAPGRFQVVFCSEKDR